MERFDGTCEKLCDLDLDVVRGIAEWIGETPLEEWPQNHRFNGQLRPSMITDTSWRGFGERIASLTSFLMKEINAECGWQHMLSVVMPDQHIPPHRDEQDQRWRCRIHVPLTTNDRAILVMDKPYHLEVGSAYKINTEATHFIVNMGATPRIHFMFDVGDN